MHPNFTKRYDGGVEIRRDDDGTYTLKPRTGPPVTGGLLNIGGRASAFPPGTTVELGGGETGIVVKGYDDERADDGTLLAVGFTTDVIL